MEKQMPQIKVNVLKKVTTVWAKMESVKSHTFHGPGKKTMGL